MSDARRPAPGTEPSGRTGGPETAAASVAAPGVNVERGRRDPLGRAETALATLCRAAVGIAFAVLIAAVLVQVIGRMMGSSPVWTEELTRFALLYLIAFGAGVSLATGDLVNVDVVCENLPGRGPWILRLVSALLVAGLCLALLWPAWRFTSIGAMQTAPALGLRMDAVHATVLVTLATLGLFATLRSVRMLGGRSDGRPEAEPQA